MYTEKLDDLKQKVIEQERALLLQRGTRTLRGKRVLRDDVPTSIRSSPGRTAALDLYEQGRRAFSGIEYQPRGPRARQRLGLSGETGGWVLRWGAMGKDALSQPIALVCLALGW